MSVVTLTGMSFTRTCVYFFAYAVRKNVTTQVCINSCYLKLVSSEMLTFQFRVKRYFD